MGKTAIPLIWFARRPVTDYRQKLSPIVRLHTRATGQRLVGDHTCKRTVLAMITEVKSVANQTIGKAITSHRIVAKDGDSVVDALFPLLCSRCAWAYA